MDLITRVSEMTNVVIFLALMAKGIFSGPKKYKLQPKEGLVSRPGSSSSSGAGSIHSIVIVIYNCTQK